MFKKLLLSTAISLSLAGSALACTTLLVDRAATADGSFLIARSADSSALKAQHFVIHPAVKNQKGMHRSADHQGANKFEYPLPETGMRYTTVPNWKTQLHGAVGWNEAGVGLSGTETIYASDAILKFDPYVEETGITEDDIPDVILPRAKTAREGVALLGKIVEEKGAGEGFGVVFVDANELWYFETGTGHQWLAQRIPHAQYFATGNQGRLQAYEEGNPNFMASKTLVSFAREHGFYKPEEGAFNFAKAYTRDDERDRVYNDPRVWQIQRMLNPSTKQDIAAGRSFPVFMTPEHKVTLEDMKASMRNHYQGEAFDPYAKALGTDSPYRPISVFRTYESHVMQIRTELPKSIGEVTYLAMGMSALSCYVPFYSGLSKVPEEYQQGTDHADNTSAYWKYRKLQTLVMTDYTNLAPIVQKAYAAWEKDAAEKMKVFEADYLKVLKTNPKAAQEKLDAFNIGLIRSAEALTDQLTNDVFTARTASVQKSFFFGNRNKKD